MNNVTINYSNSGLGSPATGEDFISGMIFYNSVYPSGFSSTANTKNILSVDQAIALGITNTSIDEVRATGTTTVTGTGSTGSVIHVKVSTVVFGTVELGMYTVIDGDTTSTIATGLASNINSNTIVNGFSASATTSAVTITAPQQTGVGGNSFTFANVIDGRIPATTTSTSFTGGVASTIDPLYYHISEYFRANPEGNVNVMITTGTSSSSSYSELVTLQNFAVGKIRQIGVYEKTAFAYTNLALMQTQADLSSSNDKPFEVLYTSDFVAVSDLTNLVDLSALANKNVSVCIGQDGANKNLGGGFRIFMATNKSIGNVGLTLGAVSKALVSTSIAWVQNFNMASLEMDTLAIANGSQLTSLSDNLIKQIDAKQYIFMRKFIGIGGSYFNNDMTSVSPTSDYSSIHNNRTIHKAARTVRAQVLPSVASPIYFNADGTIALYSIGFFESECNVALAQMVSNGEISQYKTIINSKQNVLATKVLNITVQIIPVGVANVININLGFVLSI